MRTASTMLIVLFGFLIGSSAFATAPPAELTTWRDMPVGLLADDYMDPLAALSCADHADTDRMLYECLQYVRGRAFRAKCLNQSPFEIGLATCVENVSNHVRRRQESIARYLKYFQASDSDAFSSFELRLMTVSRDPRSLLLPARSENLIKPDRYRDRENRDTPAVSSPASAPAGGMKVFE